MLGEGNGHRNNMYHYSGEHVAAVRTGNFKFHFKGKSKGGIPNMEFYNIMRDPGEEFGSIYPSLWAVAPTKKAVGMHKMMMMKYPNRAPIDPAEK